MPYKHVYFEGILKFCVFLYFILEELSHRFNRSENQASRDVHSSIMSNTF